MKNKFTQMVVALLIVSAGYVIAGSKHGANPNQGHSNGHSVKAPGSGGKHSTHGGHLSTPSTSPGATPSASPSPSPCVSPSPGQDGEDGDDNEVEDPEPSATPSATPGATASPGVTPSPTPTDDEGEDD